MGIIDVTGIYRMITHIYMIMILYDVDPPSTSSSRGMAACSMLIVKVNAVGAHRMESS